MQPLGPVFAILAILVGWMSYELFKDGHHPVLAVVAGALALACTVLTVAALIPEGMIRKANKPRFSRDSCPMRGKVLDDHYPLAYRLTPLETELDDPGALWPTPIITGYQATCSLCGLDEPVDRPDNPHP